MYVLSLLATTTEKQSVNPLISLLPFLLIGVAMYFLMIRPQRRRQRDQAALQSAISVGDEIMTTSGLYGFVTQIDDQIAWVEIDDNVQIRISRAAIQRRVDTAVGDTAVPATDAKGRATTIKPSEIAGATDDVK